MTPAVLPQEVQSESPPSGTETRTFIVRTVPDMDVDSLRPGRQSEGAGEFVPECDQSWDATVSHQVVRLYQPLLAL